MDHTVCAICHDPIDRGMHMNHCACIISFHTNCIEIWFDTIKSRRCPVCRLADNSPYHNKHPGYYTEFLSDRFLDIFDPLIQRLMTFIDHQNEITSLVFFILYIILSFIITLFILLPLAILYVIESMVIPHLIAYYYNRMDMETI